MEVRPTIMMNTYGLLKQRAYLNFVGAWLTCLVHITWGYSIQSMLNACTKCRSKYTTSWGCWGVLIICIRNEKNVMSLEKTNTLEVIMVSQPLCLKRSHLKTCEYVTIIFEVAGSNNDSRCLINPLVQRDCAKTYAEYEFYRKWSAIYTRILSSRWDLSRMTNFC